MGEAVRELRERASALCAVAGRQDGYAAVDAMVALLIISLSVVLGLQGLQQSHRVAVMAAEAQAARILMTRLLDSGPRTFVPSSGVTRGYAWRLDTQPTGLDRPIAVCRRAVVLTSAASGRTFAASTLEPCPDEPAA